MIALWIILAVLVLLVIWGVSTYNRLVGARNTVQEAFSTMDVYLKKRHDLIPNLVETVKGYAAHESKTLEAVVAARNAAVSAASPEEKIKDENVLSGALRQIFALSESYPDLKANTNFQTLMGLLDNTEKDIANARKYYNGAVKQYNNGCQMFPSAVIAGMTGFRGAAMYEVDSDAERQNVEVKF